MFRKQILFLLPTILLSCLPTVAGDRPTLTEGNTEKYQVMVLGDVHYDAPEYHKVPPIHRGRAQERKRNFSMWEGLSRKLLEAAKKQTGPDTAFAIQLGDISQGDCDTPELHENMLKKAFETVRNYFPSHRFLVIKGNHDVRELRIANDPGPVKKALLPLVAAELGVAELADGNYAFRRGKDLYIAVDGFINSTIMEPTPLTLNRYLAQKGIVGFVKKTLEANPETRYVFLLSHLPVMPVGVSNPFWVLPDYQEIIDMLEKRHAVILAAHTHMFSLVTRKTAFGQISQLITTSMGCQWTPGHEIKVTMNLDQFRDAVKKHHDAVKKHHTAAQEIPVKLNAMLDKAEFNIRVFEQKAGFTVLDIDDSRVEARIYTDDSGIPALTEVLTENK